MDDGSCDVNFCTAGGHNCDSNATCTYTGPNVYSCACNAGYSGDGYSCALIIVHGCTNGTEAYDEVWAAEPGVACDPAAPDDWCMTPLYANYDATANTDDGSCVETVVGAFLCSFNAVLHRFTLSLC